MTTGLVETPFKLTKDEIILSAAITICLNKLIDLNVPQYKVENLALSPQYGFTASASQEPCGPRFVRITDIKGGSIDWQSVPYCECRESKSYDLYSGDILIARSGSVGKTFIVDNIPERAVMVDPVVKTRF